MVPPSKASRRRIIDALAAARITEMAGATSR